MRDAGARSARLVHREQSFVSVARPLPLLLLLRVVAIEHEKLSRDVRGAISVTTRAPIVHETVHRRRITEFGIRIRRHSVFENTRNSCATLATANGQAREGGGLRGGEKQVREGEDGELKWMRARAMRPPRGATHKEQRRAQTDKQQHAKHGRTLQKEQQ